VACLAASLTPLRASLAWIMLFWRWVLARRLGAMLSTKEIETFEEQNIKIVKIMGCYIFEGVISSLTQGDGETLEFLLKLCPHWLHWLRLEDHSILGKSKPYWRRDMAGNLSSFL
jgi:hypothetical protein